MKFRKRLKPFLNGIVNSSLRQMQIALAATRKSERRKSHFGVLRQLFVVQALAASRLSDAR